MGFFLEHTLHKLALLLMAVLAAGPVDYSLTTPMPHSSKSSLVRQDLTGNLFVGGYQAFTISSRGNITFHMYERKYIYVRQRLRELYATGTVHSLSEIACNTGLMSLIAEQVGYSPIFAFDYGHGEIEALQQIVALRRSDAIRPMLLNFEQAPVPPADVVICGAVIHWLYYVSDKFLGDLRAIIKHISKAVGRYLIIEWILPQEMQHLNQSKMTTEGLKKLYAAAKGGSVSSEGYNTKNFEALLSRYVGDVESKQYIRGVIYVVKRRQ